MTVLTNWLGRLARLAILVAIVTALGSGPAYKAGFLDLSLALRAFGYAGPIALGAAALALLTLVIGFFAKSGNGKLGLIVALVVGLGLGGFIFNQIGTASKLPLIHDITTDTTNPPKFVTVASLRGEGSNPLNYVGKTAPAGRDDPTQILVSELQTEHYPNVKPLVVEKDAASVFVAALAVAENQGWEIVASDTGTGIIEATETSFWFGFKDDVVIRITVGDGGNTRVDVRSVSRVGMSDVGVNAARIEKYLDELEKVLA